MKQVLLVLLILLWVVQAPAQTPAPPTQEEAKQTADEAQRAFDLGQYDKALDLWTLAYQQLPDPGLLYKLAALHWKVGRPVKAADTYNDFLQAASKEHPLRAQAQKNVEALALELSREAQRFYEQAETDPQRAESLRVKAGQLWEEAYRVSNKIEYQLWIGVCHRMRGDYRAAIAAYRLFLGLAPLDHPKRAFAQQALETARDDYQQEQVVQFPDIVVKEPIPFKLMGSLPWKKPLVITGGALTGAGVIAAFVVRGALLAQSPDSPQIPLTELEAH